MLENSLTNTPLVTACHCLFTYHCQSLLERARVIFAKNSKIAEVVVHGGGSRGGPVASFTRTTSRHSLLQSQAPYAYPQSHAVGTDQCAIFRIVATSIDYFSLLVTACHRLFTYHCLAPVLAGKNEHRLVLFAGKSEHHLDLVNIWQAIPFKIQLPTLYFAQVDLKALGDPSSSRLGDAQAGLEMLKPA